VQEDEQVFFQGSPRRGVPDRGKRRRDFIPPDARDVEEVSLRRPTAFRPDRNLQSQERGGKKKRRPAPFEMTGWGWQRGGELRRTAKQPS
jgi:hypothetical protein